ncbi:unnamed protein product, partial [Onchocerca ochengi]
MLSPGQFMALIKKNNSLRLRSRYLNYKAGFQVFVVLRPNRNDGSFPQFCGGETKKFVLSKLVPIEEKLERNWPNLLVTQSVSSLWKHEWTKHGTCAEIVEEVNDEIKYFNKSLALHEQFDIFG